MSVTDGMARAQSEYDNATPPEPAPEPHETRVFKAVLYLTYPASPDDEEERIDEYWSAGDVEKAVSRVLSARPYAPLALTYLPATVEAVDGQWMSQEESEQ